MARHWWGPGGGSAEEAWKAQLCDSGVWGGEGRMGETTPELQGNKGPVLGPYVVTFHREVSNHSLLVGRLLHLAASKLREGFLLGILTLP